MEIKSSEKFSLKDHLFNASKIQSIAKEIENVFSTFETNEFVSEVVGAFPKLELKERIHHITACLKTFLLDSFEESVAILIRSMPSPCNPNLKDDDFGDFIYAPYIHFVAMYGCEKEHLHFSFYAIEEMTTRFSAEDAIRYFINAFPIETLAKMKEWTNHPHYHVRRLASEGSRPKLPWSQKIVVTVDQTLPILSALYSDSTRYVTRSVANHLNDISKTHPQLVIEELKKWKTENQQEQKEFDFIVRHSLRTLIKKGDKSALQMIGIESNPAIELTSFNCSENVQMNEYLHFDFDVLAKENASILIDYIIFFQTSRGEMNSRKVFKLKQIALEKNHKIHISKKHLLRQFMTTRTLYPGVHEIAVQINGAIVLKHQFDLREN
jgi:3-methyladenine DNA glycosylase AlkC